MHGTFQLDAIITGGTSLNFRSHALLRYYSGYLHPEIPLIMKRFLVLCFVTLLLITACTSKREHAIAAVKAGNAKDYASDFKGALESYSEAIEIDPSYAPAWFFRGNTHFNLKDPEKAIADYTKAIELNPGYADAYANRGDASFSLNHREEACKDYLKAEKLGKENMYEKTKWCK